MNYADRISIDPAIRSGKPCIQGTRITVYDVFDYLAGGTEVKDLLKDFPDLTEQDIQACYAYASQRERRLKTVPHEAVA